MHSTWLGQVDYRTAWDMQHQAASALKSGQGGEVLFLLEHPPVITLGRGGKREHLLVPPEISGVDFVETDRGGDVTYHGPGQLVGYPIIDLKPDHCDVGRYLRSLEDVVIRTLSRWGIQGGRKTGLSGVWVDDAKICAVGVRMSRWVTMHGFALNVNPNLDHFNLIVPCGITQFGVTSMERLLGPAMPLPRLEAVAQAVREEFMAVFERHYEGVPA